MLNTRRGSLNIADLDFFYINTEGPKAGQGLEIKEVDLDRMQDCLGKSQAMRRNDESYLSYKTNSSFSKGKRKK